MDFGCGSKPYQSMFGVEEYIGVDFHNEGHPHDNEQIDVFYDGEKLPFENSYFDSVLCSEVFEHVFNLPEIIKELHRVLKPGGKILISCPFAFGEHEVPADFARYSSFAVRHLFESSGFTVLHYEKTGSFIEAIVQLRIVYLDKTLIAFFKNIPVIRTIARWVVFGGNNLWAGFCKAILPYNQDLYLNNIVLAQKRSS